MAFVVSLSAIWGAVICAYLNQGKVAIGILIAYTGTAVASAFIDRNGHTSEKG